MGAELTPSTLASKLESGSLREHTAPQFAIWAQADANSAPLQRLQIIKGWINAAGETFEDVIDVACAGGVAVNASSNRCPDNGAKVNLSDCSFSANTGSTDLRVVWTMRGGYRTLPVV